MIKADRVAPRLHQGSVPPRGRAVRAAGFDVLVLAAREYQPRGREFPGVRVLHAPLDDAELTATEVLTYEAAAQAVAEAVREGKRVLVTCFAGLNRSGIITARALQHLRIPTDHAIRMVRKARGKSALCNDDFVRQLISTGSPCVKEPRRPMIPVSHRRTGRRRQW